MQKAKLLAAKKLPNLVDKTYKILEDLFIDLSKNTNGSIEDLTKKKSNKFESIQDLTDISDLSDLKDFNKKINKNDNNESNNENSINNNIIVSNNEYSINNNDNNNNQDFIKYNNFNEESMEKLLNELTSKLKGDDTTNKVDQVDKVDKDDKVDTNAYVDNDNIQKDNPYNNTNHNTNNYNLIDIKLTDDFEVISEELEKVNSLRKTQSSDILGNKNTSFLHKNGENGEIRNSNISGKSDIRKSNISDITKTNIFDIRDSNVSDLRKSNVSDITKSNESDIRVSNDHCESTELLSVVHSKSELPHEPKLHDLRISIKEHSTIKNNYAMFDNIFFTLNNSNDAEINVYDDELVDTLFNVTFLFN